jgi:hypothetical protein
MIKQMGMGTKDLRWSRDANKCITHSCIIEDTKISTFFYKIGDFAVFNFRSKSGNKGKIRIFG